MLARACSSQRAPSYEAQQIWPKFFPAQIETGNISEMLGLPNFGAGRRALAVRALLRP